MRTHCIFQKYSFRRQAKANRQKQPPPKTKRWNGLLCLQWCCCKGPCVLFAFGAAWGQWALGVQRATVGQVCQCSRNQSENGLNRWKNRIPLWPRLCMHSHLLHGGPVIRSFGFSKSPPCILSVVLKEGPILRFTVISSLISFFVFFSALASCYSLDVLKWHHFLQH